MPSPSSTAQLSGMTVQIFPDAGAASREAAEQMARLIRTQVETKGRAVLGLATGATPEKVYAHLVALNAAGELSFRDVTTYNLDEYYPIQPIDPKSYRCYMHRHLFRHIDIAPNRAHVLDGTVPESAVIEHAREFDRWIQAEGGLDFQLLGIGRNGHIGFNEPTTLTADEMARLPTRLVELHPITRADAAREFDTVEKVIPRALTLGVAQILAARSILMLATGSHKAPAVARALTGPITAEMPASLLQRVAPKVTWLLDEAAASGLGDHFASPRS